MSKVFILDTNKQPLDPIHPAWARKLLSSGKAAVYRQYPFTIILKKEIEKPATPPLRLKIVSTTKTTTMALVKETANEGEVVFAATIIHRGVAIKTAMKNRRSYRRGRRSRNTRYRPSRFLNRRRPRGWVAPSIESRVANVITWVRRLKQLSPLTAISQELAHLSPKLVQNSETPEGEYRLHSLQGYEVKEYLLEKWGRKCAYCDKADSPLEVEHIIPLSRGGTDKINNLTLACHACNLAKGDRFIQRFLAKRPETLQKILSMAKAPLQTDTIASLARAALQSRLVQFGLPIEAGSRGLTKYNLESHGFKKHLWLVAACVGSSTPEILHFKGIRSLLIKAMGSGRRQMCQIDKYGFPKQLRQRQKCYFGFQTGDVVRANISKGKYQGMYIGRVAVRSSGSFKLHTKGTNISCNYKYCTLIQRNDSYQYAYTYEALMGDYK